MISYDIKNGKSKNAVQGEVKKMRIIKAMAILCSAAALCAAGTVAAKAAATAITSASEITGGFTVDFEQAGATANAILPEYDIIAAPDAGITTLTSPVTGNMAAPISDRALFGASFTLDATGTPWSAIGLTGIVGILGVSGQLTVTALDAHGAPLLSVTQTFAPIDSSLSAYNDAAVFLGVESTTPIASLILTSNNPNVAWDDLRVVPAPEAPMLPVVAASILLLLVLRRWRHVPI